MQINKVSNISFSGAKWKKDSTTKYAFEIMSKEHKANSDILEAYLDCLSDIKKMDITLGFVRPKKSTSYVTPYAIIQDKTNPDIKSLATIKGIEEARLKIDGLDTDFFDNFQAEIIKKMDECETKSFSADLDKIKK